MATVYFRSKSSLQGYFPSSWGEGLCWATLGVSQCLQGSQQTVPVSVHSCTLGTRSILPWWGPWPLWSPPLPPRTVSPAFPQSWNEFGGGGSLVSCRPHSRCSFQISKAPQGHTPHLALPPLRLARATTNLAQPARSSRCAPALSWHGFPRSRSARQPRVLWLCRSALRDTCRMLRAMSIPPEQAVFQVSWSADLFSLSEHPHLE